VNVDVSVDGRPWQVAVEPTDDPGRFAVTIKGTRRVVDASWIDSDTLSLLDGMVAREVRIHRRDDGAVGVEIAGRVYDATVSISAKRDREPVAQGAGTRTGAASAIIKAPMPGRVVRVLVAVGDHVTARQGVVVVEAMKMENELRAPREGVVEQIAVIPGSAVEAGAVLVVIRSRAETRD
jgi:biotin carboxyl carrier protein